MRKLTQRIIECGITVHEHFGPGLLEGVYKPCLALELRAAGLQVETTRLPLVDKSLQLDSFYCPDIIVNDTVVVELKCLEMLTCVHWLVSKATGEGEKVEALGTRLSPEEITIVVARELRVSNAAASGAQRSQDRVRRN